MTRTSSRCYKPQCVLRWTWTNVLLARYILLDSSKRYWFYQYILQQQPRMVLIWQYVLQHIERKVSYYISYCPRCEILTTKYMIEFSHKLVISKIQPVVTKVLRSPKENRSNYVLSIRIIKVPGNKIILHKIKGPVFLWQKQYLIRSTIYYMFMRRTPCICDFFS